MEQNVRLAKNINENQYARALCQSGKRHKLKFILTERHVFVEREIECKNMDRDEEAGFTRFTCLARAYPLPNVFVKSRLLDHAIKCFECLFTAKVIASRTI